MKITNNFLLLPNKSISVSDLLSEDGRTRDEINKTISVTGISHLRCVEGKSFSEFIFDGLKKIKKKHEKTLNDIDAIITVSQTYSDRIPSVSTRIQDILDLPNTIFCIDLMDGCSGFIKALSLSNMLEQKGHKKILLVCGDINSVITKNAELGTKILFGDGISLTILENDKNKIDTIILNNGDNKGVLSCSVSESLMNMDGFEVFRFTRNMVPSLIKKYLETNNKKINEYDLIALHQASKLVVSTMCSTLKIKNSLCDDFNCNKIGNLGAGSIGAWISNINNLHSMGTLKMLAVGFGSGLSWGLASLIVDIQLNEVVYDNC